MTLVLAVARHGARSELRCSDGVHELVHVDIALGRGRMEEQIRAQQLAHPRRCARHVIGVRMQGEGGAAIGLDAADEAAGAHRLADARRIPAAHGNARSVVRSQMALADGYRPRRPCGGAAA